MKTYQPVENGENCEDCGHNFNQHMVVAITGDPYDGGIMRCPVEGCHCAATWSVAQENRKIPLRTFLIANVMADTGCPVWVAMEAVASTAMAHPEWNIDAEGTWEQFQQAMEGGGVWPSGSS